MERRAKDKEQNGLGEFKRAGSTAQLEQILREWFSSHDLKPVVPSLLLSPADAGMLHLYLLFLN